MNHRGPWWRGGRGEWYVVAQGGLFALIAFGPSSLPGLPAWPRMLALPGRALGAVLLAIGVTICAAAVLRLGHNLTPLPHPRDDGHLVDTGPYGWVRHPIYSGLILSAFGWALIAQGWLTLLWAAVLLVFFDIKSRREEIWLLERFPAYADYQRRVRRLIPLVY